MANDPKRSPHPLLNLMGQLDELRQQGTNPEGPDQLNIGGVRPRFTEPTQPLETPPAGQMPRPAMAPSITPNFTGATNQFNGMGIGGNTATAPGITEPVNINQVPGVNDGQRVTPQFTMNPSGMPDVQTQPAAPINVRPKLVDTGDPVGDAKRYNTDAEAYKPENHNGFWKGIGLDAIRGLDQGYQRTHSIEGALAGAATGAVAGAVDPTQDEYFHNENIAKPQSRAGLDRALDTAKTEAGIAQTEANTAAIPERVAEQQRKSRIASLQRQLAMITRTNQGFDPETNPEHRRLADAMEADGLPVPKLEPGVKSARLIHDDLTGQDSWEIVDASGNVRRESSGGSHTSSTTAGRAAAVTHQERQIQAQKDLKQMQIDYDRERENTRQQNRVQLKTTPGAKATDGGISSPSGRIPYSQIYAEAERVTPPGSDEKVFQRNLQAAFRSAAKHGTPYDDGLRSTQNTAPSSLSTARPTQ